MNNETDTSNQMEIKKKSLLKNRSNQSYFLNVQMEHAKRKQEEQRKKEANNKRKCEEERKLHEKGRGENERKRVGILAQKGKELEKRENEFKDSEVINKLKKNWGSLWKFRKKGNLKPQNNTVKMAEENREVKEGNSLNERQEDQMVTESSKNEKKIIPRNKVPVSVKLDILKHVKLYGFRSAKDYFRRKKINFDKSQTYRWRRNKLKYKKLLAENKNSFRIHGGGRKEKYSEEKMVHLKEFMFNQRVKNKFFVSNSSIENKLSEDFGKVKYEEDIYRRKFLT